MTRFFNSQSLLNIILWSSVTLFTTSSFAATLKLSDNLIVSEIDDKTVEHGFLSRTSQFELASGSHTLILRYKDVFEDLDFAEERVVESKNFVVEFNVTNEQQLTLTTTEISNLVNAQVFSKSPQLKLIDENNEQLVIVLKKVSDYKLAKQVDIVVNTLASKQSTEKNIALSVNKPQQAINTKTKNMNTLKQVNSLTMLKYWWKNASVAEREYFKKYINKQRTLS